MKFKVAIWLIIAVFAVSGFMWPFMWLIGMLAAFLYGRVYDIDMWERKIMKASMDAYEAGIKNEKYERIRRENVSIGHTRFESSRRSAN
jgi:hypothetical protein